MLNKKSPHVKDFFVRRLKATAVVLTLASLMLSFTATAFAEDGKENEFKFEDAKRDMQMEMEKEMEKEMRGGPSENERQGMNRTGEFGDEGSAGEEGDVRDCKGTLDRMMRDFSRQNESFERQLDGMEKDFGSEAVTEFNVLIEDAKAAQMEMIDAAEFCDFESLHIINEEGSVAKVRMGMQDFWRKWGDMKHASFKEERCTEMQDSIAKAESEKLPLVPADQQERAKALLAKAKDFAAKCDFEGLHGLEKEARKLGLASDDDGERGGVRGYGDIRPEDLKGFDGHENDLERSFKGMNLRDKNMVFDKLNKADRSTLDEVLSDDSSDFIDSKIRFLRNAENVDQANDFLRDNADIKSLLDEIAALRAEVKSLRGEIEKYNFYGDGAETVKKALEDENLSEEERAALIEKAKMESRKGKYHDRMIPFVDTDDDTYFMDAVKNLAEEGVVSGKSEGVYDPGSSTTIAEALKVILETLDLGASDGSTGVAELDGHWGHGYFKKLQELGIELPDSNVNRPITRGELASLIVRIKGLEFANLDKPVFTDLGADHPYYKAIQTLNAKGVFNGSNGKATPDASLNRADVATFMNNVLENL